MKDFMLVNPKYSALQNYTFLRQVESFCFNSERVVDVVARACLPLAISAVTAVTA